MASPLTQFLINKKNWLRIRLGFLPEAVDYSIANKYNRMWMFMIQLCFVLMIIVAVSGIVLSLWYEPSSRPITERNGTYVTLAYAKETIIGKHGDTLALKGEAFHIPFVNNKGHDLKFVDSTIIKKVNIVRTENGEPIRITAASSSVEVDITNRHPLGAWVRGIHIWAVHLFVGSLVLSVVTILFLQAWRIPFELVWGLLILSAILIAGSAWSGGILPWSRFSRISMEIVAGTIRTYVPIWGEEISYALQNGEGVSEKTLPRIFTLHAIVLPICIFSTFIAIARIVKRLLSASNNRINNNPNTFKLMLGSITLLVCLLSGLIVPLRTGAAFLPSDSSFGVSVLSNAKPAWYFLPLYKLMNVVPADLLTITVLMLLVLAVLLPVISKKIPKTLYYIGTFATILIFVWLGVLGFIE